MTFAAELAAFRAAHPEIGAAEVFVIDLNGTPRGKLVPMSTLDKLATGGMKMPSSTPGLDIFGNDVEEAGIAIQTGDPDGALDPVPGSLGPVMWAASPTAQVQATVRMPDGRPAPFDPRNVLASVVEKARAKGITPVMALELEFFLIDAREPLPPMNPDFGGRLAGGQVYDMDVMRAFEPVVTEMTRAAQALGAPTETVTAEFGQGQFEVNLIHTDDPMAAADQMVSLKRAIRGTARDKGYDATFMAKPYGDQVGSGMHVHISLLDGDGVNIFDGGSAEPNDAMRHAIAGMLTHMADSTLIFAPHLNSYRRMVPGSFVPIEATWAHDNRGSALRIPETKGKGARIEHRVSGSDANPYLVAAAILAAVLAGLEAGENPPPPVEGQIGAGSGDPLPLSWAGAEVQFSESAFIADWLGESFRHVYGSQKRQERNDLLTRVTDVEYGVYLRRL